MPTWPNTLPQAFQRGSYSETGPNNLIKSDTSIGPAKVRRKTTAGIRKAQGGMYFTQAQLDTFRTFFASEIGDGALAFTFPAQSGGGTWLVRLSDSAYELTSIGIDWYISLKLEILP